jgi:hypothetical protein
MLLKVVLAVATLILLSSIGGAMGVAAPLVLPLLWLATRDSRTPGALLWIFLAIATIGEATWIYTYLVVGEKEPFIWLIPLGGMTATGVVFTMEALRRTPGPGPAEPNSR